MSVKFLLSLFSVLFLAACSWQPDTPEATAEAFWQAVLDGEIEAARALAVDGSLSGLDITRKTELQVFTLGEVLEEAEQASVMTRLEGERNGRPRAYRFRTFLVRQDDSWQVDYAATMNSLLENSVRDLASTLADTFGDLAGEVMEEVGSSLEKGAQDLEAVVVETMESMADELQEAAREIEQKDPQDSESPETGTEEDRDPQP